MFPLGPHCPAPTGGRLGVQPGVQAASTSSEFFLTHPRKKILVTPCVSCFAVCEADQKLFGERAQTGLLRALLAGGRMRLTNLRGWATQQGRGRDRVRSVSHAPHLLTLSPIQGSVDPPPPAQRRGRQRGQVEQGGGFCRGAAFNIPDAIVCLSGFSASLRPRQSVPLSSHIYIDAPSLN